jgi:hypothetical protein
MNLSFLIKLKIKIVILCLYLMTSGCFIAESIKNRIPSNNGMAIQTIRQIVNDQVYYYKANGKFASKGEIIKELNLDDNNPNSLRKQGYRIEIQGDDKSFKIWLYPSEYNVTGKISYFFDSRVGKIQGGDHKGEKANESDPLLFSIAEESLKTLEEANKKF